MQIQSTILFLDCTFGFHRLIVFVVQVEASPLYSGPAALLAHTPRKVHQILWINIQGLFRNKQLPEINSVHS